MYTWFITNAEVSVVVTCTIVCVTFNTCIVCVVESPDYTIVLHDKTFNYVHGMYSIIIIL